MKRYPSLCILTLLLIAYFVSPSLANHPTDDPKQSEKVRKAEVKKQLTQAKTYLKAGNNLDKVESSMNKLLTDSANMRDERLHLALYESLKKQYNQGNEKLFLKQKYDTASLFLTARKMFIALERFDSIDALPDQKGNISPRYRKDHASQLSQYYRNLYTGGIYFLNHQKYDEAYQCMDTYLSAPEWPLFSGKQLKNDSTVTAHASYIALVSGYRKNDFAAALKYKDNALLYAPRLESSLQYLCDIYLQQKDMDEYMNMLRVGVDAFPKSTYFFPRLVDKYCESSDYEHALSLTDNVIKADSANLLLHVTRQTILLNLTRYDESINEGKQIIAQNDSIAEAYYNIALAYYNQVVEIDQRTGIKAKERTKQVNALYKKCLPYMEKYRSLAPEQKKRWRPVLYTIYLNLNLGKEFAEIEKVEI